MSMSMDFSAIFEYAAQLFAGFAPIVVVIGGVFVGVSLVWFVMRFVRSIAGGVG